MVQTREEAQKKFTDSEEFRLLLTELEHKKTEVAEKDSQLEEMYNKMTALEHNQQSAGI